MARQYYYLLSSLPELFFLDDSIAFDFLGYKEYISENINKGDLKCIDWQLYPIDNKNIINYLYGSEAKWEQGGLFTLETWNEAIDNENDMPAYLLEFLREWGLWNETGKISLASAEKISKLQSEKILFEKFYNEIESSKNKFSAAWFRFDREVRNIQAAYVAQRLGVSVNDYLIGNDYLNEILQKDNIKILARERDYLPELLNILQTDNLMERERRLDLFRWKQIDELSTFEYFSLDAILAFLQKALILDRWMKQNPEIGKAMFNKLVSEMKSGYKMQ